MRQIQYPVAVSLDGYLATADGGYDWIPNEPDIDFGELLSRFDTLLMGRKTYELYSSMPEDSSFKDMELIVVSSTLKQRDIHRGRLINENLETELSNLRAQDGKDIWLFGGGQLFSSLLALRLVDIVELAVAPVLLGGGIPMAPPVFDQTQLTLESHTLYPTSGMITLRYRTKQDSK